MKHIKKFNEAKNSSDSKKKYDMQDIFSEFSKSKRKNLEEIRTLLTKVDDERYEKELKSYISNLSKTPPNLMKDSDGEYMGMSERD